MQEPLYYRQAIPFFCAKSEKEIQADVYERFDPMVLRQSVLHLADDLWGSYPMQPILDLAAPLFSNLKAANILEIGCSVGRWIGDLAKLYPSANCWGLDYSYQLLKQAHGHWIEGKNSHLNISRYGFSAAHQLQGERLTNLKFGLAKAEALPFENDTQDIILNSFLFDRLASPEKGMQEMFRVLKPGGKIVLVTPLNFSKMKHWEEFYPPIKMSHLLTKIGFTILDWRDELVIEEPLDKHGNCVRWKCVGVVLGK